MTPRATRIAVALHEQAMEDPDKAEALVQAYKMLKVTLGMDVSPEPHRRPIDGLLEGHRRTLARRSTRRTKD